MKNNVPEQELDQAFYQQFGQRIRVLREQAGYTQEAFANQHGFDRAHYGSCERGHNMTIQTLRRILSALDISIEQFFKGF